MFFEETVDQSTLELLKTLMRDKAFDDFILVGGTALALQIGHRISIDLDLFSTTPFEQDKLADHLRNNYNFILDFISINTLKGEVEGTQLDCISHQYPLIDEIVENEGIRMSSLIDIAAMKLNAISGNGTRLKDFIDITYLSSDISLSQMLSGYEKKYRSNPIMPLKAILYFKDINFNQHIKMASGKPFDWKVTENRLHLMQRYPDKIFHRNQ